ncbi:helix-turn-helix domain-containing protein [Pseudoglutamicibacter albus]|nr:excisionase family DNA binding protein [Pseudoglutamicibacter albus]
MHPHLFDDLSIGDSCELVENRLGENRMEKKQPRFLRLEDVADELNVSMQQARSLVRTGALPAIKVGGRGIWRIERDELESYIQRQYEYTREAAAMDKLADEFAD